MANSKMTIEELNKKYGVNGKDKPKSTKSSPGKQSGKSGNSTIDELNKKYGVGEYSNNTRTTSSPTLSGGGNKAESSNSKPNKTLPSTSTKKYTDFNGDSKNAYTSVKTKTSSSTTLTSNLTEEERKKRIKEITAEMQQLNYRKQGLGRASAYGTDKDWIAKTSAEIQSRLDELSAELKSLERVGTFTASQMKQFEIEDAKAEKAKLPNYNPTARVAPSEVEQFKKNVTAHHEAKEKIDVLERQKDLYDNISEFGNVVNNDDFGGQWSANYRSNEINREADKAMSEYIRNPTEENKEIAYAYDAFAKAYMKNNEKALDDENVQWGWLTKSMAGYLPQFKDQIVPELVGGALGTLLLGKVGGSIGSAMGTYSQTYDVMRGSVYRTLLAEGIDEETARKAAEDEALISSLIESGSTAASWVLLGGSKAMNAIGNAAKSSVAKGSTNAATGWLASQAAKATDRAAKKAAVEATRPLWQKAVRTGGGIALNAGGEYLEEFTQGAVSEANREQAMATVDKEIGRFGEGNIDLYNRPIYKNDDGSISTVDSVTFEIDGKYVVLPTIVRDENGKAKRLETDEEIIAHYVETGECLGQFNTLEDANGYANKVHIAQAYYYGDKTVKADDNLWEGGAKVVGSALSGDNPELFSNLHSQGAEGFKIGLMFGGSQAVINNTASHYINKVADHYSKLKTDESKDDFVDELINDEESLKTLIETGKESGKVSAKFAEEIETTIANGKEVTRNQVKKLIEANKVYIAEEEKTPQPASLEQAAIDVVNERNKINGFALLEARKRGEVNAEILDALSQENVDLNVDEVRIVTGFGNKGAELVTNLANLEGNTFTQAERTVKKAYYAGFMKEDKANLELDSMGENAYTAGELDRQAQDIADKTSGINAVVNKDSGFVAKDLPSDVTQSQVEVLDLMSKALGYKSFVKKGLKGNAEIQHDTGEVAIDFDFEREVGPVNNRQKVSIVFHAAHEMALHGVVKRAPEEGRAFVYAMYKHLAGDEPSVITLADEKRSDYAEQGVNISLATAMEEISANNILYLYGNDEGKFRNAIERIVNGNDTKAKQGLQKYIEYLKEIIRKIRNYIAKKTGKARAELQAELDEVTKLRDMFESAVAKGVENTRKAEAKSAKNLEIKTNQEYNGNVNHSLKWHTDLSATQIKQVEKWLRQVSNHKEKSITDTASWYKGRIDGEDLFVIYSTVYNNPTILYEIKGKEARVELDILLDLLEVFENGESINGESNFAGRISNGNWMQKVNNSQNNLGNLGSGQNNQNAGVLPGQSQRNGSPAFWNVVEDIFGREEQERSLNEGKKSHSLKDSDYLKAVENNDMETAQSMVDEVAKSKGYTIRAYHGTSRGDRVGNVFLPERATSGPMAFFTDNREIAEGYSKSKPDTSMAYDPDYDSYETQFRIKMKNMDIPLYRAWGYLPFDARNRITQKAQQLREDWDGDGGLILDPNTKEANGGFQWQLKMARGNTLLALNEQWLNSGILFNEESRYLEVLEMAGVMEEFKKIGEIYFKDPDARHEKVYDTYLRITKPFDTSYADDSFVDGLLAWYEEQDETQYERENMESDLWDKNGIDAYEFADRVRSDIENGTFHAWTSIPDSVTDYLKSLGYDGIKDLGGKNSDVGHTVWIPFSSEQIKSSEPVTYDNEGNVIPLSQRFNNENVDIRYSLKNTNNTDTKARQELLDIIEHLKGEFEVTKFAKADSKKLAKLTKDILKEYSSKADYDETRSAIDELYTYMANGEDGNTAVWDEVYNRAYNIAQNIVENSLVVDDEMYTHYKSLRDYLRTTAMKFDTRYDSVPSSYENFNEFRKLNMGRLKFTNDGRGIDSVYQELAGLYPEFFNEEEQNNASDQLERIIEVLDELQPTQINPFDRQISQVSMQLANDLTSRFFDLPQAKPTFADKAERRVVAERIKNGKKVEAVREKNKEKIKKLIESQKAKTKKQLDKIREQRNAKVKKEQEKRRDAISKMSEKQKVKVLRARIMRHTSDLSKKLVNPTDNQHIPYEMQGIVAKLLESINLESNYTYDAESGSYKKNDEGLPTKRTQAFNDLKKIYGEMSSSVVVDPDLLGENGWLSEVISLADKRIADMNSKELDTVWQAIRAIEASVSTANKIFSQGKFGTILEYAEALRVDNAGKKEKVEFRGVLGKGKKLATLDMLTPETYFHYLGSAGDSIFRMMRDAQDKHISIMKEVTDFTHKTLKGVDVNSLEKKVHTVKLGGEDVKLTTAQLMELYVLMKREQAREHILIGGILPDITEGKGLKLNTKAEPIRNLTIEEVAKALSKLTVEEKNIAAKLQNFVSTVLSEYGNEASMKVYNYEKFLEKNYWTIRTNKQEIASEVGKDTSVTSVANKGMAKGTVPHANTSVRLGSIFDTFASHSSDMATYAAWLGTSEDINRIRNFVFWEEGTRTGTVKGILDTVHGMHGSDYLQKLLTDVAIGVKGTDNMNPFDKLVGNYKAASVGANLRVVIQQPTAILRATDMIGAHYLAEGAIRPLKGWEKAKKYAPIAQWKDWGHFDINTGRQMKDVLFDNASRLEKAKQIGMWGASMADSLAWGQLWNAVEFETKAKHKDLEVGSEEYYETVAKRFTEIVDHTQVVDGILQRSQIMRSPDALTKMATSFMGEPTKQYNMALSALYDAKNSKGDARKKAVGRLGRTALTLVTAGIINACAQSIVDALRDDDKEKDYWEKWLAAFVGYGEDDKFIDSNLANTFNPLSYVPFAKDILSVMQGYDVKRMDTESITKTVNAITNMYKAITGTGKYTVAEASAQLFAEVARLYGLPVANVKRDVKAITTTVAIETDSYVMQYRMEKAMLNLNFAGNSKNFMDILFNAYNNDREAYEFIYNDMLKNGYDAEKIQSGMETRMKKAEGVEKSSELTKRYMSPETEDKYDSSLNRVKSSDVWKSANAEQRKNAEADLYKFLTSTTEDVEKLREEARMHGVDETEYTLYQLAIEMADQPKGQKGSGSYDLKEKAEAINSLNLGDEEIAYFFGKGLQENAKEELQETLDAGIDMQKYVNFKAAVSDMEADKNAKGNSIPNSKKKKVVKYLNNANLTDEEWEYFYYEVMNYKK